MRFEEPRGPQPSPRGGPLLFAIAHTRAPAGCCPNNSFLGNKKRGRSTEIEQPPPSANPVSRVLYPASAGPLSFIYDCGHPQPPATYPSTSDEQSLAVDIHGLATRKAYSRRTLLPPRWALTPPFHPYLRQFPDNKSSAGGHSLLRYYTLTDVESLARAALCVARTFLPPPKRAAIERICR